MQSDVIEQQLEMPSAAKGRKELIRRRESRMIGNHCDEKDRRERREHALRSPQRHVFRKINVANVGHPDYRRNQLFVAQVVVLRENLTGYLTVYLESQTF